MREISLTKGQVTIVDDADFESLSKWKWHADLAHVTGQYYAARSIGPRTNRRKVQMQRQILGLVAGDRRQVDHVNHNTLDNRRSNLRIATAAQNQHNQKRRKNNRSGVKGVRWNRQAQKWQAQVEVNGKIHYFGGFKDFDDAVNAVTEGCKQVHGEFFNRESFEREARNG